MLTFNQFLNENVKQLDEISKFKQWELRHELAHEDEAERRKRSYMGYRSGRPQTRHIFKSHKDADTSNPEHVKELAKHGVKPTSNGKSWHTPAGSSGSEHMKKLTGQTPTEWTPKS